MDYMDFHPWHTHGFHETSKYTFVKRVARTFTYLTQSVFAIFNHKTYSQTHFVTKSKNEHLIHGPFLGNFKGHLHLGGKILDKGSRWKG